MAKHSPSIARNQIRRSLMAIIDPYPTADELAMLWKHFSNRCAYCDVEVSKEARDGQVDHIISAALGGKNGVHNHVLACGRCNGDEKRELDWLTFLEQKIPDQAVRDQRQQKIIAWIGDGADQSKLSEVQEEQVAEIIKQALQAFDVAVTAMRELRDQRKVNSASPESNPGDKQPGAERDPKYETGT
ncbi:HNH endonuclease [Pseudomonas sp. NY15437]|uniref:HNH endonuclease n=1 Tax=Pseudomonas sp. NY15437 TaxID=3400360 RepID=UPI003A86D6B5